MSLRAVKGMKDILPDEISKWHRLESAFRQRVEGYGFLVELDFLKGREKLAKDRVFSLIHFEE